jgi:hypothetical protein
VRPTARKAAPAAFQLETPFDLVGVDDVMAKVGKFGRSLSA